MNHLYENPINAHTAKVLMKIEEVIGVMDGKLDSQLHKFHVLEQAVEMNLWVQIKVMHEGVEADTDPEQLVRRVRELQREYLAVVAISNFLGHLATTTSPSEDEG